jgi:hypothetical protein
VLAALGRATGSRATGSRATGSTASASAAGLADWRRSRLAAVGLLGRQRVLPVCPSENRPGCGQTHSPWGPASVAISCSTAPVAVSKT